jgi:hypothetical protein
MEAMFLRKVGLNPNYTVLQHRRPYYLFLKTSLYRECPRSMKKQCLKEINFLVLPPPKKIWRRQWNLSRFRTENDEVKEDEMSRLCSTHGTKRNSYNILVKRPEGKRPVGRLRRGWVNNIKLDHRGMGWDGMDWIDLAQNRDE